MIGPWVNTDLDGGNGNLVLLPGSQIVTNVTCTLTCKPETHMPLPAKQHLSLRKVPTQARATFTVNAILEATAYLLKSDGYDQLTTNAVAELAGFSVGTLYQYFTSKEALMAELRRCHHREVTGALLEVSRSSTGLGIGQFLRKRIAANIRVHAKDPVLHYLLSERYGDVAFEIDKNEPRFNFVGNEPTMLERLLSSCGRTSKERARIMAQVCGEMIHSLTHAAIIDGSLQLEGAALEDEILCTCLGYLQRAGVCLAEPCPRHSQ